MQTKGHFVRNVLPVLAAAGLAGWAAPSASASLITWDLTNVTFSDGATATGFFTYNADTQTLGTWAIAVTDPTYGPGYFGYTTTSSSEFSEAPTELELANFSLSYAPYLILGMDTPMTDAGGTISLELGSSGTNPSLDCWNGPCGSLTAGEIVSVSGPEPSSMALSAAGALLLAGLAWRSRRASLAR